MFEINIRYTYIISKSYLELLKYIFLLNVIIFSLLLTIYDIINNKSNSKNITNNNLFLFFIIDLLRIFYSFLY